MNENKRSSNTNKKVYIKKRNKKLVLVFDENARREFLTGFHKRKIQRRNKAKEEFEKQLKLERKRIKAEAKEAYKKLLVTQRPIPDVEDLLAKEIDMGTHSVKVTELSSAELAKKNNWIGINEVKYEGNFENETNSINEDGLNHTYEVEGMEIKNNRRKSNNCSTVMNNCKDVKKLIKYKVTQSVKNSKIFKQKAKIEKLKNIKIQKNRERKKKFCKKNKRLKHKNERN